MRLHIGLVILVTSPAAFAAREGDFEAVFHSVGEFVLALFCLVAGLLAIRWLCVWRPRRNVARAAATAVKERMARGQKPYC